MSRDNPSDALGIVIVALAARRFLRLSDAQLRDLSAYLKSLAPQAA